MGLKGNPGGSVERKKVLEKFYRRYSKWLAAFLLFSSGLFSGWLFFDYFELDKQLVSDRGEEEKAEKHEGTYGFVNPLLECESPDVRLSRELTPFKEKIELLISEKKRTGMIKTISVYFRDLNNGPWFGINEREEFVPASLLKIPLMIGYLKLSETNPGLMTSKLKFEGNPFPSMETVLPDVAVKKGHFYTVEELIYIMIVYSDNNAAYTLRFSDKWNSYKKTYADFGLQVPGDVPIDYRISVKKYASFFRILFNSSYLNKELSNKALEILSKVDFKDGLVAGVPEGVTVSHKFGERADNEALQLHDCGIVYYPDHPYLLCIMSRGQKFEDLATTIQDISRLTYKEVDSQMHMRSLSGAREGS